ncbi:MAG: helix-turn-helix domain-containing protein [Lewinellaceae bacterium]|nr:helix-turn-helix domain-containing protein [Lewinellaceae bacterium]
MPDPPSTDNGFLQQVTEVIEEHLSDEQFGVSELAREVGMSRSNLLRKVKKQAGLSVSQYIRQVRLEHAMEMLKQSSLTVSEISFRVGFNSTSYFIKCFREHYGYPPGEAENRSYDESEAPLPARPHRLVAIMFTDIEGYTALMQQNEEKALQFRNRHREVFNAVTKKYNGKILQYYGDGTLSIFQSAIDAVKCGIELQLGFRLAPQIPVRVGIHSGDIIINEEDIIGDGVNVASRIESLAAAGSVFISEKVYDEVKNQADIQTASMGSFEFKNVSKPLEVYAVTNPGLAVPEAGQLTGKLKIGPDKSQKTPWLRNKGAGIGWVLAALAVIIGSYLIYRTGFLATSGPARPSGSQEITEKSIAVLPFINDSNDSTNVYIINGLMESILNNLQKIGDLRVISRTSVERYRNSRKAIPEIGRELGVYYFVEGSGQKDGDQILLSIQLIEASTDRHLWSEQYNRQATDIFHLQAEVARKIADEIQAIITPEEEERIEEVPTENLEAYDAFLKGLDLSNQGTREGLLQAIPYYEQATRLDPEFARPYAGLAIDYYYLDLGQAEKQYSEQINNNADKALLYGPQLPQSLVAKGLYYLHQGDYESALPHLEKALEYNPNFALAINILADFYTTYEPDSEKYLEYALKGIRLDIGSNDSSTASFTYLHLSNALVQCGFVPEAEKYINRSLDYDPNNLFSAYVKAYILYAEDHDLAQIKERLLEILNKDTTRLDVLQEVAKICYFMRDYEAAYRYYKKFTDARETYNLDIYPAENAKIAMTMRKVGREAEAQKYMQLFRDYTATDQSIYKHLNEALISAFDGEKEKTLKQIQQFSKEDSYHYWILLFMELSPLLDNVKTLPAFKKTMRDLDKKFWARHERISARLKEQNLI